MFCIYLQKKIIIKNKANRIRLLLFLIQCEIEVAPKFFYFLKTRRKRIIFYYNRTPYLINPWTKKMSCWTGTVMSPWLERT